MAEEPVSEEALSPLRHSGFELEKEPLAGQPAGVAGQLSSGTNDTVTMRLTYAGLTGSAC